VLQRYPYWPSALDKFLADNYETKFEYGKFDCCLFVCSAIEAMTGTDIAAPFRGRYRSRREALRAVWEYAGKGTVRAVAERVTLDHGMPRVEILLAQRGDVALIGRPKRDCSLGIIALTGRDVIVLTAKGMQSIPLTEAAFAWRV
jgi:hypothetical protein